ncbi:MAG: hypothetical protein ACD_20C00098G0008 [uncultured bacterium]|nr:MAG: hypothetical protein ACD_20C00098G0008 [uncultured bacterium]HBH18922.1 hypothetical protein [Cyanobacteria bacterium UBA9579]
MLIKEKTIKPNIMPIYGYKVQNQFISGENSLQDKKFYKIPVQTHKAYALSSLDKEIQNKDFEQIVQSAPGKYFGKGLFEDGFVDWSKVGWQNLKNEPINWNKAKESDIMAFWHALALTETKESPWVQRYNPTNSPYMLSTHHTLTTAESKANFHAALNELNQIADNKDPVHSKPPFLDQPIISPETGKLNINFIVFDTETTGVNFDPKKGPVDKIIQIGAVKIMPGGKIEHESVLNQLVNPEMEISKEATKVHHITNEEVRKNPTIHTLLKNFTENYLKDNLIVAYNAKFDIPMLNNAIKDYNEKNPEKLQDKKLCLTLDPFVILQRIHPFLGASKKLTEQHKFLFGQGVDNAHDALEDVKATVNVLKYCCHYLNKHYKPSPEDPKKHLTVRDLLTFQTGGKVKGLDIELNSAGIDASKRFNASYIKTPIGIKNYPYQYSITKDVLDSLAPIIGPNNTFKINKYLSGKKYTKLKNFKEKLQKARIRNYDSLPKKQIIKIITDQSTQYKNYAFENMWIKNANIQDVKSGNDLPDIDIVRKIMQDKAENNNNEENNPGDDLPEILTKNL